MLLKEGQKLKLKDISKFFDITEGTMRAAKTKERYLSILQEYCDYETVMSKSGKQVSYYLVKEVYNEGPYESKKELREKIIKFYQEEWGKDDVDGGYTADSPAVLTDRFCSENGIPWSMPHVIYGDREFTYKDTGRAGVKKDCLIHNPEAKKWWQVYGILTRQIRKDIADKKFIPNKIWLLRKGLHIARPTEEQTKIIEAAAEKCFGQKHTGPQETRELVEYLVSQEQQEKIVSINELGDRFPFLAHVKDNNRWEIFNQSLAGMGIKDTVKGSEHKKDEFGKALEQIETSEQDYYEW